MEDHQQAINETHPFGVRIWQPPLYRRRSSLTSRLEEDIHSAPSQIVSKWLWGFNILWTVCFGWWLAMSAALGALVCFLFRIDPTAVEYQRLLFNLSGYLFWPFGKVVYLRQEDRYADEDEGEGRAVDEYQQWQSGRLEYGRLLFGPNLPHTDAMNRRKSYGRVSAPVPQENGSSSQDKTRLFGRGQWTGSRVWFFVYFYSCLAPLLLITSAMCWLMVFWMPMSRITVVLVRHLRQRPLALSFQDSTKSTRSPPETSTILICTYRAVGLSYWKYSIDGTNILLFNSLGIVIFAVLDFLLLKKAFGLDCFLTSPIVLFVLGLLSMVPLSYFIGDAVASISAQSSMGVAATLNAFFSTIIEVYLYCIALPKDNGRLVEGSVIGSLLGGILLMPGLSMCFGALKRKTQRFNVDSTHATNTMLLFATVAAFGPSLFYETQKSHTLICDASIKPSGKWRRCYWRQTPADDELFNKVVRPYTWLAALLLFSSYLIGLLFTLRTHAATIWKVDMDGHKTSTAVIQSNAAGVSRPSMARVLPGKTSMSNQPNGHASQAPVGNTKASRHHRHIHRSDPYWSRRKSALILLTATLAYMIIAEILVDTVNVIRDSTNVDEKFLGLTLIALVPNTTEFINAVTFAMKENIALSMEIGSAYALQVCLLQIPALVLFSAVYDRWHHDHLTHHSMFRLILPTWDIVCVFFCVFLLSYLSNEGKSNYFKGSILLLAYTMVLAGFYLGDYTE